jgi:apolipoprotein D and lipocalin family protein
MADPSIAIGSAADHYLYRRAAAGPSMRLSGIRAAVFCDHPCQPVSNRRDNVQMRAFFILAAALLAGCAQVPDGVEPVRGFDAERYLGKWYEIARLDHRFERGMDNVTATYAARDDGGIDVLNRGYLRDKGEWQEARGRARFVESRDRGMLQVSFFGPFYGGYNVVDLDPGYQVSLVAGPSRQYLWILARQPDPPRDAIDRAVRRAAALGFDTNALIWVRHGP